MASNDVVVADSVACTLMGYDLMEIIHIRRAHEEGLGRIVEYDPGTLPCVRRRTATGLSPTPRSPQSTKASSRWRC